jgi:hypothetical protein
MQSLHTLMARTFDAQVLSSQIMAGLGANAPNFPFPQFTGDNPNLWKTQAEQYFLMFTIHESYWVPMSILHFSGAAGIWLQSVQKKIASLEWISFTSLLCTRFGWDRHQLLIRQFYTIKQITTVADYIERFDILMNHLVSYLDTTHTFYFLTRFVEGLRSDIRAYNIQRVINPVAYEVKLPEGSKVHPIFHVSQLRKVLRPGTLVSPVPHVLTDDIVMPLKILAHRWHRGPHGHREQVHVPWSDPATLDITWEDKGELHQRFPTATAWGQPVTEEGGDVRQQTTPEAVTEDMGLTQHRSRPKRIVQPNRRHVGPE